MLPHRLSTTSLRVCSHTSIVLLCADELPATNELSLSPHFVPRRETKEERQEIIIKEILLSLDRYLEGDIIYTVKNSKKLLIV